MTFEGYITLGFGIFFALIIAVLIFRKLPRRIKHDKLSDRWKQLQQRCADEAQWAQAIIEADDLLIEVLKKKRFKGNSAGERLVKAQKRFSNNDAVWYGHKLRSKIEANPNIKLTKDEVKRALIGFHQGLKDIGALK